MQTDDDQPVILYDGVCAMCNGIVRFVIRRDRAHRFRFAALQSDLARKILTRHGENPDQIDTMRLIENLGTPTEKLWSRSDAVVRTLQLLGGIWQIIALGRFLPRALRDRAYALIVNNRYRVFGKYDTCPLPPADLRNRFLE